MKSVSVDLSPLGRTVLGAGSRPSAEAGSPLLLVRGLAVNAAGTGGSIIRDVDFDVHPGEAFALVGESGSGKTTIALALLAYSRPGTKIVGGQVWLKGENLLALGDRQLRGRRAGKIAYVAQNPDKALSPGMKIGRQLDELLKLDEKLSADDREARIVDAFAAAQLPTDRAFRARYPHQLSGGQKQRVAIGLALVGEPAVIVMDEPTTGLDVVTQERLLDVIRALHAKRDVGIVYVSHDLSVVRQLVSRVGVVYGGLLVEQGSTQDIFRAPRHPYTRRLLEAVPRLTATLLPGRSLGGTAIAPGEAPRGCPFAARCDLCVDRCLEEIPLVEQHADRAIRCHRWREVERLDAPPDGIAPLAAPERTQAGALLEVREVCASYGRSGSRSRGRSDHAALGGVSFRLEPGACLAIVGESGSGKTTLGRCISGLHAPDSGEILFKGQSMAATSAGRSRQLRRQIQIIFQDADSSLNPTMTVGASIERSLILFTGLTRAGRAERVCELLHQVSLPSTLAARLPAQLSGGQKQRVAIARAIAAGPELLVCDEITSALDVVVQASILRLLDRLRRELELAVIFISHDLSVVKSISDYALILKDGVICETGPASSLFNAPKTPYAQQLLTAAPDLLAGDYPGTQAIPESPQSKV